MSCFLIIHRTFIQVLLKKLNREMQQEGLTPAAVYESVGGGKEILPKLHGQPPQPTPF